MNLQIIYYKICWEKNQRINYLEVDINNRFEMKYKNKITQLYKMEETI